MSYNLPWLSLATCEIYMLTFDLSSSAKLLMASCVKKDEKTDLMNICSLAKSSMHGSVSNMDPIASPLPSSGF